MNKNTVMLNFLVTCKHNLDVTVLIIDIFSSKYAGQSLLLQVSNSLTVNMPHSSIK